MNFEVISLALTNPSLCSMPSHHRLSDEPSGIAVPVFIEVTLMLRIRKDSSSLETFFFS